MWVTKLLISPVKKRIFCPKTTKFSPKLAFFVHCWLIWCPVGGLDGGCSAGCISQDTYLLYHKDNCRTKMKNLCSQRGTTISWWQWWSYRRVAGGAGSQNSSGAPLIHRSLFAACLSPRIHHSSSSTAIYSIYKPTILPFVFHLLTNTFL